MFRKGKDHVKGVRAGFVRAFSLASRAMTSETIRRPKTMTVSQPELFDVRHVIFFETFTGFVLINH